MVSVIIPAYQCEKYIAHAVLSVLAQETEEKLEILIVDDASEDGTGEAVRKILEGYPGAAIRYHRNKKNMGAAETRNVGIRAANGEYLAFLDADDWWDKDKIFKQQKLMKKTGAPLVFTGRELMRPDGVPAGRTIRVPRMATYEGLLRTNCIPCSSVLMKTDVAREFYMCHDELHEDYILWLNVLKKYGPAYGIDEPLLKSRLSAGGKSRNKLKSAKMHYGVYRHFGIPAWKAAGLFLCYAWNGFWKYR